jgi:hypothetical protein
VYLEPETSGSVTVDELAGAAVFKVSVRVFFRHDFFFFTHGLV